MERADEEVMTMSWSHRERVLSLGPKVFPGTLLLPFLLALGLTQQPSPDLIANARNQVSRMLDKANVSKTISPAEFPDLTGDLSGKGYRDVADIYREVRRSLVIRDYAGVRTVAQGIRAYASNLQNKTDQGQWIQLARNLDDFIVMAPIHQLQQMFEQFSLGATLDSAWYPELPAASQGDPDLHSVYALGRSALLSRDTARLRAFSARLQDLIPKQTQVGQAAAGALEASVAAYFEKFKSAPKPTSESSPELAWPQLAYIVIPAILFLFLLILVLILNDNLSRKLAQTLSMPQLTDTSSDLLKAMHAIEAKLLEEVRHVRELSRQNPEQVEVLQKRVDASEAQIAQLDGFGRTVEALQTQVSALESPDKLQQWQESVAAGLLSKVDESLQGTLNPIRLDMGSAQGEIEAIKHELVGLQEELRKGLDGDIGAVRADLRGLNARVAGLAEPKQDSDSALRKIEEYVAAQRHELDRLTETVKGLFAGRSFPDTEAKQLENKIAELKPEPPVRGEVVTPVHPVPSQGLKPDSSHLHPLPPKDGPWASEDERHFYYGRWWSKAGRGGNDDFRSESTVQRVKFSESATTTVLESDVGGGLFIMQLSDKPGTDYLYPDPRKGKVTEAEVRVAFDVPRGFHWAASDYKLERPARCAPLSFGRWQLSEKGRIKEK